LSVAVPYNRMVRDSLDTLGNVLRLKWTATQLHRYSGMFIDRKIGLFQDPDNLSPDVYAKINAVYLRSDKTRQHEVY
jgi:hypothetical protein